MAASKLAGRRLLLEYPKFLYGSDAQQPTILLSVPYKSCYPPLEHVGLNLGDDIVIDTVNFSR